MKPEVKINFTGGEPLTSPLTIPVAEYAKKLGIKCTLMTNGTLIFEAMANASGNIRLYEFLQEIGEHYATKKKTLLKCGVGEGQISISHNGDVYPCTLLHNPQFKAVNIAENSLIEIYNSPAMNRIKFHTAEHMDKCRMCDFKLICGGSCQARNFLESGDLDRGGGDFCEYDKQAIVRELMNSAELSELQ